MVRWLGIVLILISSGYWGIRKTAELRRRPRLLKAAADSLKLIRSDIAFRLLPLPDTLRHAAQSAPAPLRHVYAALSEQMCTETQPFSEQWRAAFDALPDFSPEDQAALCTLGEPLGKYDADAQVDAIDYCVAYLQSAETQAREDTARRGKLYAGLGLTFGLIVAVTLY